METWVAILVFAGIVLVVVRVVAWIHALQTIERAGEHQDDSDDAHDSPDSDGSAAD